jgi:hypothetical protein
VKKLGQVVECQTPRAKVKSCDHSASNPTSTHDVSNANTNFPAEQKATMCLKIGMTVDCKLLRRKV